MPYDTFRADTKKSTLIPEKEVEQPIDYKSLSFDELTGQMKVLQAKLNKMFEDVRKLPVDEQVQKINEMGKKFLAEIAECKSALEKTSVFLIGELKENILAIRESKSSAQMGVAVDKFLDARSIEDMEIIAKKESRSFYKEIIDCYLEASELLKNWIQDIQEKKSKKEMTLLNNSLERTRRCLLDLCHDYGGFLTTNANYSEALKYYLKQGEVQNTLIKEQGGDYKKADFKYRAQVYYNLALVMQKSAKCENNPVFKHMQIEASNSYIAQSEKMLGEWKVLIKSSKNKEFKVFQEGLQKLELKNTTLRSNTILFPTNIPLSPKESPTVLEKENNENFVKKLEKRPSPPWSLNKSEKKYQAVPTSNGNKKDPTDEPIRASRPGFSTKK